MHNRGTTEAQQTKKALACTTEHALHCSDCSNKCFFCIFSHFFFSELYFFDFDALGWCSIELVAENPQGLQNHIK
jgi:hypothetical protein